jgi:hypothetical protein
MVLPQQITSSIEAKSLASSTLTISPHTPQLNLSPFFALAMIASFDQGPFIKHQPVETGHPRHPSISFLYETVEIIKQFSSCRSRRPSLSLRATIVLDGI